MTDQKKRRSQDRLLFLFRYGLVKLVVGLTWCRRRLARDGLQFAVLRHRSRCRCREELALDETFAASANRHLGEGGAAWHVLEYVHDFERVAEWLKNWIVSIVKPHRAASLVPCRRREWCCRRSHVRSRCGSGRTFRSQKVGAMAKAWIRRRRVRFEVFSTSGCRSRSDFPRTRRAYQHVEVVMVPVRSDLDLASGRVSGSVRPSSLRRSSVRLSACGYRARVDQGFQLAQGLGQHRGDRAHGAREAGRRMIPATRSG